MPDLCLVTPKYVSRTTYSKSSPLALWTSLTSLSFFMQKGPDAGAWDLNKDSHSWKARTAFLHAGFTIPPCTFQAFSSRQCSPYFPLISTGGSWLGGPPWMVEGSWDLTQQLCQTLPGAGGSKCGKQMCKGRKSGSQETRKGSTEQPAGTAPVPLKRVACSQ